MTMYSTEALSEFPCRRPNLSLFGNEGEGDDDVDSDDDDDDDDDDQQGDDGRNRSNDLGNMFLFNRHKRMKIQHHKPSGVHRQSL